MLDQRFSPSTNYLNRSIFLHANAQTGFAIVMRLIVMKMLDFCRLFFFMCFSLSGKTGSHQVESGSVNPKTNILGEKCQLSSLRSVVNR